MIKKMTVLVMLFLLGTAVSTVKAQPYPSVDNVVDIVYNGIPVTIDGDLDDWEDAHWVYNSQDHPFFLDVNGNPIQGIPESANDFSYFFAMKMDDENVYFAIKVRDEGTPMIEIPDTPNLAFNYDHMSVYLGLYDIGNMNRLSPHIEGAAEGLEFYDPVTGDTVGTARTYRIAPGVDNMESTLGADYQLLIRNIPYEPSATDTEVQAYSGALVDTLLLGTTAASRLTDDETGYIVEWKVPFASLAGHIARPGGPFRNFEWPLFEPEHGMVIPFDVDVTDLDEGDEGLNRFLRLGRYPALWRDSKSFGMRGRIVDVSLEPWNNPAYNYYVDYKPEQDISIDGDLSDWEDAYWIGYSQDHPFFLDVNGNPIQGIPDGPADFSYYFAMKMDDENAYFALRVRDEVTPMIEIPDTPNLAFNYDHMSVYLGLYDIGQNERSPHIEGATEGLEFYDPVTGDTVGTARTYRIAPGVDNMESSLGPDYQLLIRNISYNPNTTGTDVQAYSGALVDTLALGTTAASALVADETGYTLEWKVPFETLAGHIARPGGPFRNFEWPLFVPEHGQTIAFDVDVTDLDEGDEGLNRFLRLGRYPALWRDSKSFNMRGKVVQTGIGTFVDDTVARTERPTTIGLEQNYPNPFNPTTNIRFTVPESGHVSLNVYNLIGQRMATLVNQPMNAGTHTVTFDTASLNLSSGLYLYRLEFMEQSITRKMLLVK